MATVQKFKVVFQGLGGELDHRIVETREEIGEAIVEMVNEVGSDAITEDDGFHVVGLECDDEGNTLRTYPAGWTSAG